MKYNLSLYQRMQQKMTLTPQMRQSIQLLGMSIKELNEYINSLLEKNPFLRKLETKRSTAAGIDFSSDFKERPIMRDEDPRLLLLSQLRMLNLSDKAIEIAEYLIYEMDDNGYLKIDAEEAARDLMVDTDAVKRVISIMQNLEPAGIGARDVRECLQLQLKRLGKEGTLEYTIVTDFINELAKDDLKAIADSLHADKDKVLKAIKNIKKLNPRPASTLLSKQAEPVMPDLIANISDDKIELELNRESAPHLRIYNPYEEKPKIKDDPEVREFLKKNLMQAKELLDNLNRREETMCRVADYILNFQKSSLTEDLSNIKSLTLRDVAKALEFHPSTISRTISNKFIQINGEVVALKTLLSDGIKKKDGQTISKTAVKNKIKELINHEDKKNPLSDKMLKDKLKKEGISIKRRTVAKYRESLRMLPTYLRRRRSLN